MLFFTTENSAYVKAVYDIETLKADVQKLKYEIKKNEETKAAAQASAELINDNIEYLQKYTTIVSMKEWTNLQHMRASELEVLHFIKLAMPSLEKSLRITLAEIARLELELPSLKSKVLEFKPRG